MAIKMLEIGGLQELCGQCGMSVKCHLVLYIAAWNFFMWYWGVELGALHLLGTT
jgi:hypothetical protein